MDFLIIWNKFPKSKVEISYLAELHNAIFRIHHDDIFISVSLSCVCQFNYRNFVNYFYA